MHFLAWFGEVRLAAGQSPTVRRRRLGHELRELRERAGLTLDEVSAQLEDFSAAKISRIETARVGVRSRDVVDLLDLYGVRDAQRRENLITLTRESRQRGWWEQFSDAIPPELDLAIGLEAEAVAIRIFSPHFVGGLLQTEAYARALLKANRPSESSEHLERRVELRMERQKVLEERDRLEVQAILDETVLRRPVGGYRTLHSQLRRLIEMAQYPNISIRVLPLRVGAHPGGEGAFRIIDLSPPDSSVVHLEYPNKAAYLEEESEVRLYAHIFERLEDASLTNEHSLELIATKLGRKRNES
jgi:transcriptional regulator with XRE-family HTH domain